MGSIMENFQNRSASFFPTKPLNDDLPISNKQANQANKNCLRKRLTSLSVRIQPLSSSAAAWSFRRSNSTSSTGELAGWSLRRWWDWGVGWIMSRKPTFARDLEMNEEESAMLGFHFKGSLRHVFYKVRSELRRFVGGNQKAEMGFGYDSFSYKQNFDDGKKGDQEH